MAIEKNNLKEEMSAPPADQISKASENELNKNGDPDIKDGATKSTKKEAKAKTLKIEKITIKKSSPAKKKDDKAVPLKKVVAKRTPGKSEVVSPEVLDTPTEETSVIKAVKDNIKKAPKLKLEKKPIVKTGAKKTGVSEMPNPALIPAVKATAKKKSNIIGSPLKKISFQLRFHTRNGENIFVTGNHALLGNNDVSSALPLQYLNEDYWFGEMEISQGQSVTSSFSYKYFVKDEQGKLNTELGSDKVFDPSLYKAEEIILIDSWSHAGYIENTFFTEPFKNVLLKDNYTQVSINEPGAYTHIFRIKAPLLAKGQVMCILGSASELGKWEVDNPTLMLRKPREDWWTVNLDLSGASYPITYKYGVYDVSTEKFTRFEDSRNRVVYDGASPNKLTILSDGFAVLPGDGFKGAGVAIPVFSLRSKEGLGVGEFNDIKLLVDWAKSIGLKVIQILPVNDTVATHTWVDSYPYAAISAFALHPLFLHLPSVVSEANKDLLQTLEPLKEALNALEKVEYEQVINAKLSFIKKIYLSQKEATFADENFISYFKENEHWLVPYASFSYLRDEYGTPDFSTWPKYSVFNELEIQQLALSPAEVKDEIGIHYFIQFHLHLQLKAATRYAHENGIIVKGDIPIGIYRNSSDAWQEPALYNMDKQAGAPPDDFAVKGQNWGFPTYNWQSMQQDGFAWWKKRFAQMRYYFDAFRIDHILGFFRIWSIPMHAVEGIMGTFVPALPVHKNELEANGIHINIDRLTRPYINDGILWEVFGEFQQLAKEEYLTVIGNSHYALKPEFNTQRKVEAHFKALSNDAINSVKDKLKHGLFNLISNVILIEVDDSEGQQFHFRIAMENTPSFHYLDGEIQYKLKELYINYFFRRQDNFWEEEAMHKLPELKRSTNMLICGEDLGMVPDCVPGVMKRLGILSLEIQRMPKDPTKEFFHPNDAPYLSVVTPSTHDMSTIRGWWEEDRIKTQRFYNHHLGKWGSAPFFCEPEINTAIVIQHLYSPAMWSIFQLQDILGMDGSIRRLNPADERINVPANPKHYWQYRMHIGLEELLDQQAFNDNLRNYVAASGR